MSNELRTPLAGMFGVHDLLQSDSALNERQRHLINLAQESGSALLTIVNDILDFSEIEAGQMAIERIAFSAPDLIENCHKLAAEIIKGKLISLRVDIDPMFRIFSWAIPFVCGKSC